jgi:hypothetical protein
MNERAAPPKNAERFLRIPRLPKRLAALIKAVRALKRYPTETSFYENISMVAMLVLGMIYRFDNYIDDDIPKHDNPLQALGEIEEDVASIIHNSATITFPEHKTKKWSSIYGQLGKLIENICTLEQELLKDNWHGYIPNLTSLVHVCLQANIKVGRRELGVLSEGHEHMFRNEDFLEPERMGIAPIMIITLLRNHMIRFKDEEEFLEFMNILYKIDEVNSVLDDIHGASTVFLKNEPLEKVNYVHSLKQHQSLKSYYNHLAKHVIQEHNLNHYYLDSLVRSQCLKHLSENQRMITLDFIKVICCDMYYVIARDKLDEVASNLGFTILWQQTPEWL